jgi:ribosome-binding factor A
MTKSKEPTQRQLRVGEEIRHTLAAIFMRGDFMHPDLRGKSVTVSEVDVAPDMRNATAYVSLLGGGNVDDVVLDALNTSAGEFNKAIAKHLTMKFTPRIKFRADNRFDYAEKIETILKKI